MNKRAGAICLAAGVVLLLAAALLLYSRTAEDRRAGEAAQGTLSAMQAQVVSHAADADEDTPGVLTIDGYDYVGYLSLPSLGIELPVMADWDYTRLKIAPCRCYGSVGGDDLVIAGHNYKSHFRRLKELQEGDAVRFTDAAGWVHSYRVCLVEILEPDQVDAMLQSPWALTLYTCTIGGRQRVTVRCERAQ